jgi:hypothetical protein
VTTSGIHRAAGVVATIPPARVCTDLDSNGLTKTESKHVRFPLALPSRFPHKNDFALRPGRRVQGRRAFDLRYRQRYHVSIWQTRRRS